MGNMSGTTDNNDLADIGHVDLRIAQDLFYGLMSATEEILAESLETSTSDGSVEVDTFEEGVNFDGELGSGREGTLSMLASSMKMT